MTVAVPAAGAGVLGTGDPAGTAEEARRVGDQRRKDHRDRPDECCRGRSGPDQKVPGTVIQATCSVRYLSLMTTRWYLRPQAA